MQVTTETEEEHEVRLAMRERDEAFQRSEQAEKTYHEWRQRWALSLALANGGALLALFTAMIGDKRPWELLPCGAFFLGGLLAAGHLPYALSQMFYFTSQLYWAVGQRHVRDFMVTDDDGEECTSTRYKEKMRLKRHMWLRRVELCERLSALLFAAGGASGLIFLTLKLFRVT